MNDNSHLDRKYFIDEHVYNCPFCNRNNVQYFIKDKRDFNWNNEKMCRVFFTECQSCRNEGLHLTFSNIETKFIGNNNYIFQNIKGELDDLFFYHQPTSFFTIDERINSKIRDLISESEGCLKMGYNVGASACLRKAIYELLGIEKTEVLRENGYVNYQDSIKSLKEKFTFVQPELFDAMGSIQELVSDNIHEKSWEKWDSKNVKEILYEMYVIPAQRKERFGFIPMLKKIIIEEKLQQSSSTDDSGDKIGN